MYKTTFAALALIGAIEASATANEDYDDTLQSCNAFAAKFQNTCSGTSNLANMASASVTCAGTQTCPGTQSGDNCTWNRKLCVSCRDDSGTIKIRVQTNGLPSHCFKSPQTAPAELTVDWESTWLSPAGDNAASMPVDQNALNALLCDDLSKPKDSNVPSSAGYSKLEGQSQNTAWGVATSGVLMFSSLSAENVDPFYPAAYADVTDPDAVVEKVDWCLAHPQVQGVFHYHSAATCLADAAWGLNTGKMDRDVVDFMKEAWNAVPYRTAVGVSKDGRPILSPYKDNGVPYGDCEVDVCNGKMINGHYQYVTTFFHPYIMGCYGKGNKLELYQQCSTNPRLCNVVYDPAADAAMAKSVSLLVAGATAVYATLF